MVPGPPFWGLPNGFRLESRFKSAPSRVSHRIFCKERFRESANARGQTAFASTVPQMVRRAGGLPGGKWRRHPRTHDQACARAQSFISRTRPPEAELPPHAPGRRRRAASTLRAPCPACTMLRLHLNRSPATVYAHGRHPALCLPALPRGEMLRHVWIELWPIARPEPWSL